MKFALIGVVMVLINMNLSSGVPEMVKPDNLSAMIIPTDLKPMVNPNDAQQQALNLSEPKSMLVPLGWAIVGMCLLILAFFLFKEANMKSIKVRE